MYKPVSHSCQSSAFLYKKKRQKVVLLAKFAGLFAGIRIGRPAQLPTVWVHIVAGVGGDGGEAAAEAARAAAVGRNAGLKPVMRIRSNYILYGSGSGSGSVNSPYGSKEKTYN